MNCDFGNTMSRDKGTHEYRELRYTKARSYIGKVQVTSRRRFHWQYPLIYDFERILYAFFIQLKRLDEHGVGSTSRCSIPKRYQRTECHSLTRLFIGILVMGSLPGIHSSELSNTICKYFHYKDRCENDLEQSLKKINITEGSYCLGSFTHNICWPHTPAGRPVEVPCPDFFGGTNDTISAIKFCTERGTWFASSDPVTGDKIEWAAVEDCIQSVNISESDHKADLLENLRIMYTVGYTVSLICLVLALMLLSFFKKLHCTRNYIHMNLMISFILRYTVILVKDSVLDSHYNIDGVTGPGLDMATLRQYCDDDDTTSWVPTKCRLAITLMHYAVTANYFWLLAEGLYLQTLLVFVKSKNKYLPGYMVLGWGAPWISVLVWVVLRMHVEDTGCWDMNMDMNIWWTIRAPIMTSILINFCLYINIVKIISNLRANNMTWSARKLRLAKTFLYLIPLLGIHYIVFLFLLDEVVTASDPALHLKLAFELFFSSIQGAIIAVLYCFLNNKVRAEVSRSWSQWRQRQRVVNPQLGNRRPPTFISNYDNALTSYSEMRVHVDLTRPQTRHSSDSEADSKGHSVSHAKTNGNSVSMNMIGNRDNLTV